MDHEHFDAFTRIVGARASRRTALGAIVGGALLGSRASIAARPKGQNGAKPRKKRKGQRPCYPGKTCLPGQGKDNSGCDFSGGVAFFERKAQGSNLSHANFTDAQMAGANFQGADLGGACLVGANLLDAVIDASTNLEGAIFCRTLMPDGSFNDQNCGAGTRCCPAPLTCKGDLCPTTCIGAPNAQCSLSIPYGGCCPGLVCVPSSTTPIRTTCQGPCGEDGSCRARFGTPFVCAFEPEICRYLQGQCCQHI